MTDGPFVESKEHIAGFYITNAKDLDAALGWAELRAKPLDQTTTGAVGQVALSMSDGAAAHRKPM